MSRPLLLKLTTLVLVVTLLSMGVTIFFIANTTYDSLLENLYDDLISDARLIDYWLREIPKNTLQGTVVELGNEIGREILIVGRDGFVLGDSEQPVSPEANLGHFPEIKQALVGEIGCDHRERASGEEVVYLAVPGSGNIIGAVRISSTVTVIQGALSKLYRGAMLFTLVVALFALLVTYLINRNITDPLNDLLLVTKRLKNREFGRRVLVRSKDEIGQLGRSFNELSMTLEKMFDTIHDRESKLNAILSSMEDGVLAVNTNRMVILANRAFADLMGEDDEAKLIGKDQGEVILNFDLSEIIDDTMTKQRSINAEIHLFPDSDRVFAISSSPLETEDHTIIGIVCVLRDISKLRKLESVRKEFVANVSHELRTPLTSIKGFVETILSGKASDPAIMERFLRIVSDETERMIALINDLLDLSRIESGKEVISMERVCISQIFADTIDMLETKAADKEIVIENHMDKHVFVFGNAKYLRQVAINLVDNAVKYTKPGGKVWVEAKQHGKKVEIIVGDTGVGIPEDQIGRIFERFYRVDKGRSRSMGGTGLGLSIVKHIIDKHKGKIYAESEVDKGTLVKIVLSVAK